MDDSVRYQWIATHILPYRSEVRGWLRRRLGSLQQNDIDDVLQEAFARIWEADFSTIHNGRAYLYTTVSNLLAEYVRRRRIVPIELLGEIEALSIISEEPGPERRVSARQELERIRAIVAKLPTQCRRVFELRKFDGLSHKEVARQMGLSEKTVENHLTRALARVAAALADTASSEAASGTTPATHGMDILRGID
jgi:RNA polymerase sigma factor (sigma-70 family)